ncbi:MAG: hypothetical protein ABMA64_43655 [Myxococcota bacterium]
MSSSRVGWVIVGWSLACSGVAPEVVDPEVDPGTGGPLDLPDRLAAFVPAGVRPTAAGVDDDGAYVRYGPLAPSAVVASWPSDVRVASRSDQAAVGVYWSDAERRFGVLTVAREGTGLTLRDHDVVPVGLERGACPEGQVELFAPWATGGDGLVRACAATGAPPRPLGVFRVEDRGVVRLEGEFGPDGGRTGTWTSRDAAGAVVSTGAFADDRPFGRWVFGSEPSDPDAAYLADNPHPGAHAGEVPSVTSFAFVDGATEDAPLAYLPLDSADPHPYGEVEVAFGDADLAAGWVHLSATYRGGVGAGPAPQICPPDGRGERALSLRPDRRAPSVDLPIRALAFDGEPCTDALLADQARAAAVERFAADRHADGAPPARSSWPAVRVPLAAASEVKVALPFERHPSLVFRAGPAAMSLTGSPSFS